MIKSLKITMPNKPEIKNFLTKKLAEYTERVEKIKKLHPDVTPQYYYDAIPRYKAFIVRSLLSFGEIETKKIASEIKEEIGAVDTKLLNLAAQVIYNYCEAPEKNVKKVPGPDSNGK